MNRPVVVGFGEVLWDLFESAAILGGAPANFACHANSLGAEVFVVSGVGDDQRGQAAIRGLVDRGVDTSHLQNNEHATGTVDVKIGAGGEGQFTIAENTAWDRVVWNDDLLDLARRADAVCFGTLFQRSPTSRETLSRFLHATAADGLRVLDVNLRANWYDNETIVRSLEFANVVKLNTAELSVVARAVGISGQTSDVIKDLLRRFEFKLIALTDGENGSQLFTQTGTCAHNADAVLVRDTVGAGDAFTACVTIGLLRKMPIDAIGSLANSVAAWVCTQDGATPDLPAALVEKFA